MANIITEDCVNCGACEPMCPSNGISRGADVYLIDPERCSECVGFYHTQQCARVCPVDASVLDPSRVESEEILFERARKLQGPFGDKLTLSPETSRFRAQERGLGSTLRSLGRKLGGALRGSDPAS